MSASGSPFNLFPGLMRVWRPSRRPLKMKKPGYSWGCEAPCSAILLRAGNRGLSWQPPVCPSVLRGSKSVSEAAGEGRVTQEWGRGPG